jgi:hypothetical protein
MAERSWEPVVILSQYTTAANIWAFGPVVADLVCGLPNFVKDYKSDGKLWCEPISRRLLHHFQKNKDPLALVLSELTLRVRPGTAGWLGIVMRGRSSGDGLYPSSCSTAGRATKARPVLTQNITAILADAVEWVSEDLSYSWNEYPWKGLGREADHGHHRSPWWKH